MLHEPRIKRTKAIVRPVPGTHRYAAYAKMLSRSIFACKLRLVAKHHSSAEPIKITLMEHQKSSGCCLIITPELLEHHDHSDSKGEHYLFVSISRMW